MPTLYPLHSSLRAAMHYTAQPEVIRTLHRFVQGPGVYGAFGLKAAYDILTAKPEKRGETALRDGFILGPILLATKYGLKTLAEPTEPLPPVSKAMIHHYPSLKKLFERTKKLIVPTPRGPRALHVRDRFSFREIRHIVQTVLANGGARAKAHLGSIFPLSPEAPSGIEAIIQRLFALKLPALKHLKALRHDKVITLFKVGAIVTLAGLAGGMLYDYWMGVTERRSTANKIKESFFQCFTNFAMCSVGLGVGVALADSVKRALKISPNWVGYKGLRFGLILSSCFFLDMVMGSKIANWIGRKLVNPFFEWLDKRHTGYTLQQAIKESHSKNDRRLEPLMDGILHFDDIFAALSLVGAKIFVPFIPLLYAISGYRAGIGYRNSGDFSGNNRSKPGTHIQSDIRNPIRQNPFHSVHSPLQFQTSDINFRQVIPQRRMPRTAPFTASKY